METVKKQNGADDPERAIKHSPRERDLADLSANEGERDDRSASHESAAENPGVTNRIAEWSDKKQRDHQMTEGEPVGSVRDEGKGSIGLLKAEKNEGQPSP